MVRNGRTLISMPFHSKQKLLEQIVQCFKRLGRPIIAGAVALEIGYSLNQTQALLDELEITAKITKLSDREKINLGVDTRCLFYSLTVK